uniref:Uncharacterized protein n=1 Tax=Glossina morsitans morsitans TaxID=37546 RepID=A0A1B0FLF9_GLOMM
MPVVLLLLFQVVAGLALLLFLIHYVCYIANAVVRDFCETLLNKSNQLPQQLTNEEVVARKSLKIPTNTKKMQNTDDAKFIKNLTRWKGGSIEPHPSDRALIVNYQLEATVFGDPNNPMLGEKKVSRQFA